MGGGIRKAGFKGVGVKFPFSGFCEIAACVNSGVTLKGLRGGADKCENCLCIA